MWLVWKGFSCSAQSERTHDHAYGSEVKLIIIILHCYSFYIWPVLLISIFAILMSVYVRPYKCETCDKTFGRTTLRKAHMRVCIRLGIFIWKKDNYLEKLIFCISIVLFFSLDSYRREDIQMQWRELWSSVYLSNGSKTA